MYLFHSSYSVAHRLWRVGGEDVGASSVGKVSSVATIEGLAQVGTEGVGAAAQRCPLVAVGVTGDNLVEAFAVGGGDVLYVGNVFEAPLNLERGGTSLGQPLEVVYLTEVFQ